MHQPKMIVLGLIARGLQYGLEMEQHVRDSNMRVWAKIGTSTIYKALRELQKDGSVTASAAVAKRGPGKTVYRITPGGRAQLRRLVREALSSRESVFSDRIAGLVFALSLPPAQARKQLAACIDGLDRGKAIIQEELDARDSPVARIVLDFTFDVLLAEQKALAAARRLVSDEGEAEATT